MPNDALHGPNWASHPSLKPAYRLVVPPSPLGRVTNNGPCGTIKGKKTGLQLCTTFRCLLVNASGAKHTCSRIWALTEPGGEKTEGRRDVNACVAGWCQFDYTESEHCFGTASLSTRFRFNAHWETSVEPQNKWLWKKKHHQWLQENKWCHSWLRDQFLAPFVAPGQSIGGSMHN